VKRVLAVRQDNNGDVLLAGPALRAIAASAEVTLLAGPRGAAAAKLLPGVADVLIQHAAWIDAEPEPVRPEGARAFVEDIGARRFDAAVVFTSFHQSPLPMALLLRMAGVPWIGAISVAYAGTLLDLRHRIDDDVHEVHRALSLAGACGFTLPPGDDGRLAMRMTGGPPIERPYVVVHPGATVPARAWSRERNRSLVERLAARRDRRVVVTGGHDERELTAYVAGHTGAIDLGGKTDFGGLAATIAGADAIVVGNTGAAHVAAAVGTPVISLFPPTIAAVRFRPWGVPHRLLGDQDIPCRGCRARVCPIPGQPCLGVVEVDDVVRALEDLLLAGAA